MPLDVGVGVLLSIFTVEIYDIPLTWGIIIFGIAAALLPDIDIVPYFFRGGHDHRSFTHYPILYVPLTLGIYYFLGSVYATLFALGVYAHLIHDTIGIGWGISWLWPFSDRRFLFFPEKGRREQHGLFMSWNRAEQEAMAKEHHRSDWVREFYFRPNMIAYVEYGTFIVAIVALFLYTR